ncbi:Lrp/AsnC family transcriptional regulator [Bacillus sp. RG28]|uniref:Lrp/AsnC family transcriptional regulator n=1 Tax=Gottfriedia endophytica TaxID=2820819 RepID=A0A940NQX9_9BACI|nr:Lrp/AsnC family transcriptional regulator [Gottfriedia endophytica]MBP0726150.1 Lrp/AsnC family transcriptional regulator [Gottfriedia endophytica]
MNEKEIQLLQCIEQNGRLANDVLAKMIDVSEEEIVGMLNKFENDRVILQYITLIDWGKVPIQETVTAMIDVKVTPKRGVGFDEIAEKIYRYPEVKSVYLMSGTYDLSVVVEGKTMTSIASFVSQKLSTLDSILSTTTHFILKRYKHDSIMYDQKEDDKRMVVTL